jgi:hypothetical protein
LQKIVDIIRKGANMLQIVPMALQGDKQFCGSNKDKARERMSVGRLISGNFFYVSNDLRGKITNTYVNWA